MTSTKDTISRRGLLHVGVAASGLAIAARAGLSTPAMAQTPAQVRVRRNVYGSGADSISHYREGVRVMKARPESDKTSWMYQANIHGTTKRPLEKLWFTCQHGNQFFLSWHRMYVYYFERIVRDASGNKDFNLPYWDYENAGQRVLPEAFRLPALDSNVLYTSKRSNVNDGVALPASAVSATQALTLVPFDRFNRQVEMQPHNVVHTAIGGQGGLMSSVTTAAQDPIFWLHHCNIDRLWAKWLAQGGGREDPTSGEWATKKFEFYDVGGELVELSGQQIVDTARQLGYEYDDVAPTAPSGVKPSSVSQLQMSDRSLSSTPLASTAQSKLDLGTTDAAVTLHVVPSANRDATLLRTEPTAIVFDDISLDQPVGIYYEIYLNKPESAAFDAAGPYFAGSLSFFALDHAKMDGGAMMPASRTVEIGSILEDQFKNKLWSGRDIKVELHPQSGGTAASVANKTLVSVGKVELIGQ